MIHIVDRVNELMSGYSAHRRCESDLRGPAVLVFVSSIRYHLRGAFLANRSTYPSPNSISLRQATCVPECPSSLLVSLTRRTDTTWLFKRNI